MSFTTMNMFAPRISASDPEMRAARRAGWCRWDLIWERLSEDANGALAAGDTADAVRRFRRAYLLARIWFSPSDPRFAASLANAALADRMQGRTGRASRRFERAIFLWAELPGQLEDISISPRARSSLFHLRMEARHWDTYSAKMRVRRGKFLDEAAQGLAGMAAGQPTGHRYYSRWRGEKPNVFDDTRKYLSAALLLAAESN